MAVKDVRLSLVNLDKVGLGLMVPPRSAVIKPDDAYVSPAGW